MAGDTRVRAWRPEVPGVVEVFHAHMISHVYPMHTHEAWTLLIVDDGMVRYDLHRHEHGALDQVITLLPPQVPHNGRAATSAGFGKRVVYLDLSHVPASLIGPAVDQPLLSDPLLRQRIHELHHVLGQPGEEFEAENRLAFITERLRHHLSHPDDPSDPAAPRSGATVAYALHDLIDARFREKVTLREASDALHAHPAHLVRMFSREFGISPHQYLTSRRVDLARRLLLGGMPPGLAAAEVGFCDQSHLSRHFTRVLGTTPGRFARSGSLTGSVRVHNFGYTLDMDDIQAQLSVRDARAHLAEVITRAQDGTPTIITRNGQAVAAIVPIEDFNALEDAIDRYFAREADRDLADNPDAPTYSMSEVVAAIFEEEPGKGAA
ncbi:MAG: type II toxin-antitoxin system prevent-host-death family antitoxin [Streptosporangiaceae bacterium]